MDVMNGILIAGLVIALTGWIGARFSEGIAKKKRLLVRVGLIVFAIAFAIQIGGGFVRGVQEGYHDAMKDAAAARR